MSTYSNVGCCRGAAVRVGHRLAGRQWRRGSGHRQHDRRRVHPPATGAVHLCLPRQLRQPEAAGTRPPGALHP